MLVTAAIAGAPVSESGVLGEAALRTIVEAAGRDLALIHSVAVDGFGRLRGPLDSDELAAPLPTRRATLVGWNEALATIAGSVLSQVEVEGLKCVYELAASDQDSNSLASLAHGDFSTRHIFQHDGCYTGIIDFGDSRGDERWYDLGYFHMRDGGLLPYRLEAALLTGYRARTPFLPDADERIREASVLIAVPLFAASVRRQVWNRVAQHLLDGLQRDVIAIAREAA